jgi:hypothetical protein
MDLEDTIKIERPMFSRRKGDKGGRVKHDSRGNAVLVKTRAEDSNELPDISELSFAPEEPRR